MPVTTLLAFLTTATPAPAPAPTKATKSLADILAATAPTDWRPLDLDHTLYLELPAGRVIIELAPDFAPKSVDNIVTLVREQYFDGLAILRSQDNYVVQWGDPNEGDPKKGGRSLGTAKKTIPPEFTRDLDGLSFDRLKETDVYAPEVGFAAGFPAARAPKDKRAWLTHCYGAVGVGRDNAEDSGNGAELYVVIGHAPRHLDRNITLVGRVVRGMELLSTIHRGTGALGFFEKPEERVPIRSVRLASSVPPAEQTPLEALRTDTPVFQSVIEARRNRKDDWYKVPAGAIELCNVPLPVRDLKH